MTIKPDELVVNADWPKRTKDAFPRKDGTTGLAKSVGQIVEFLDVLKDAASAQYQARGAKGRFASTGTPSRPTVSSGPRSATQASTERREAAIVGRIDREIDKPNEQSYAKRYNDFRARRLDKEPGPGSYKIGDDRAEDLKDVVMEIRTDEWTSAFSKPFERKPGINMAVDKAVETTVKVVKEFLSVLKDAASAQYQSRGAKGRFASNKGGGGGRASKTGVADASSLASVMNLAYGRKREGDMTKYSAVAEGNAVTFTADMGKYGKADIRFEAKGRGEYRIKDYKGSGELEDKDPGSLLANTEPENALTAAEVLDISEDFKESVDIIEIEVEGNQ